MKNLQDWADTYKQKLIECGFENVTTSIENETIVIEFEADSREASFITNTLLIKKNFELTDLGNDQYVARVIVDESFEKPITDMDRLNNKIFKRNLSSSYDHHAKRFIETLKHFYDIDLTFEEYDELCRKKNRLKMQTIYRINGAVQVAKMLFKEKWIYIIFGQTSDRGLPPFKTALPDLFGKKTLLPVPDKVLKEGIDRVSFTKEAHQTVIEKREYYQTLLKETENMSDKELFLSEDISRRDKVFIKKLRNSEEYGLIDAIKDITEKYNRRLYTNQSPESITNPTK